MAKILVIDDDEISLTILRGLLRRQGHEVRVLDRSDRALDCIQEFQPDLVVTDIMMPGSTGGAVYAMIRKKVGAGLPVIVCSATRLKIKQEDPLLAHLSKPVDSSELDETVRRLLASVNSNTSPPPSTDPLDEDLD
ncbi:MAG: response regulator [Candidatus Sumerlaeaceae bacterium]|nr:response regulator [Candidatus Sumerlaeaceae bacterium]